MSAFASMRARAKKACRAVRAASSRERDSSRARARTAAAADVVALGHTRDDQAETVLLRLTRGAGPRGLSGMHPRNGAIVRPLLACRRDELRAWLAARGLSFVDDETNSDVNIPRNRVRGELLPLLASRFNPAIVDVLAGEAELARDAWDAITAAADETASRIVKATDDGVTIDRAGLLALPTGLRRAVLWRAMSGVAAARTVGFEHVYEALRMLDSDGPTIVDAPGQRLERLGDCVVLRGRAPDATGRVTRKAQANLFRYPLSIPGEVRVSELDCVVSADAAPPDSESRAVLSTRSVAVVRGDLCGSWLAVRTRRPGDRFRPVGVGGGKKLQDFFVDRKVARADRDRVPIVVDESDRIVWVAGYGIDEAFRVTNPGQAMLTLRLSAARLVR